MAVWHYKIDSHHALIYFFIRIIMLLHLVPIVILIVWSQMYHNVAIIQLSQKVLSTFHTKKSLATNIRYAIALSKQRISLLMTKNSPSFPIRTLIKILTLYHQSRPIAFPSRTEESASK